MNNWSKRLSALLLSALMIIMCVPAGFLASAATAESSSADYSHLGSETTASDDVMYSNDPISGLADAEAVSFESSFQPDDVVTILVKTGEPALSFKSSAEAAKELAFQNVKTQETILANIESSLGIDIVDAEHFGLLFNGFSFEGEYWMIEKINAMEGLYAGVDYEFEVPEVQTDSQSEIVNANYAWDLGYTGEGQVIAILDTGTRLTHEAFSVMPENPRITPEYLEIIYDNYASLIHGVSEDFYGSDFYHNKKVPIGISYVQKVELGAGWFTYRVSNDVSHYSESEGDASDHGTHVAAIAAGNNGSDFRGIAPDAQLAIFQVSGTRSIATENVLSALEDCVYLGVDVINMSFGSSSAFTSDEQLAIGIYADALALIEDAGIGVAAAAGNDGEYSSAGNYAGNTGGAAYADYPDNSRIGTPASYTYPIAVASSDNALKLDASINVVGEKYGYIDNCEDGEYAWITLEGEHTYVHAGLGRIEDIAALDLENKIALVQRGELSFEEKMQNVHAAGAVGIIVYNNTFGTASMQIENYLIPAVSVTREAGEAMLASAVEGVGTLTIELGEFIDYSTANNISSFSSIGSTSDMRIKPEITAPGGNISSAIGFGEDNSYEGWNGTSMATPAVAGGYAILMQALEERFPDMHKYELREIAGCILLSTASPLENTLVRAQGAGLMDLAAASTADAYLSVPLRDANSNYIYDFDRPKVELMDSAEGTWWFEFIVNPLIDEAVTYEISAEFYTLLPTAIGEYNGRTVYTTDMIPMDISDGIVCTLPETFTFDPTVNFEDLLGSFPNYANKLQANLSISEELAAELDEYFVNGTFIEGYITLTPVGNDEGEEGTTLSIPLLAFYGDWDAAPVLDPTFWWMDDVGMDTIDTVLAFNISDVKYGGNAYAGMDEYGVNPYVEMTGEEFLYDRISYSPNDDTRYDLPGYIQYGLLRDAAQFDLNIKNGSGELLWEIGTPLTNSSIGYKIMLADSLPTRYDYAFDDADIAEGETCTINLQVVADITGFVPENNEFCSISIPMTLDTAAPVVSVRDGQIVVFDAHYAAYVNVCSDEYFLNSIYSSGIFETERGAETLIDYEGEMAYVFVGDYAMNEKSYAVNMTTGEITEVTGGGIAVPEEMAAAALYDAESGMGFKMAMSAKWPFEMAEIDDRTVIKNSNSAPMTGGRNYTDSDSVFATVAEMQAGQMLRFEYYAASEDGFDWFRFYVNGEKHISISGDNRMWDTFTFIAPEDGVYNFEWMFEKDQQVGYYEDVVYIDNIYIGDPTTPESLLVSDSLEVTAGHKAEIEWSIAPYTAEIPTFESIDESILTVDYLGIVTGVSEGEAEVIVTAGELTKRVSVTVLPRGEYTTLYGHIAGATWSSYNHDVWFDTDMLDVLNMPEAEEYKDSGLAYADGYFYYTYTGFIGYIQGLRAFRNTTYKIPAEEFGNPEAAIIVANPMSLNFCAAPYHLDYNYEDGIMYAVRADGKLYSMGDLETIGIGPYEGQIGEFTCDGASVAVIAFAFADDGAYAIGYTAADTETMLYRVDITTAECTVVGSTGIEEKLSYTQSMTYDYERGIMFFNYISSTSKFAGLNSIDLETGAATRIGGYGEDFSGAAQIVGLSCITNGPTARECTVTFVDGLTGDVIDEQSVLENESAVAPEAPIHEGYEFLGWRGDYTEITEDTTVTAVYAAEIPNGVNITAYNLRSKSWVTFNSSNINEFETQSQWSDTLITAGEYVNGTVYGSATISTNYENFLFSANTRNWEMQQLDEYYDEYMFIDAAYDYSTDTLYMLEASEDNNYAHLVGFKLTEDGGLDMVKDIELTCDGVVMSKLNTLAITTDGYAYSVEKMSGVFYSIDLETGECELVGETGVNLVYYAQSMFFDHSTNRMFWAAGTLIGAGVAGSSLYEINYLTGEATLLGEFDRTNVGQIISGFISNETPLMGDVNEDGEVNELDALMLLRHSLGITLLPEEEIEFADYDGDGEITALDALAVLRAAIGV